MKTIDIEKVLDLAGAIDLSLILMKDQFAYQKEEGGIRCVGPFFIKGNYTTIQGVKEFQDVFEFDIYAASEKLDGEPFKVVYDSYDYSLQNGVSLTLHFSVYGIKEEEAQIFSVENASIETDVASLNEKPTTSKEVINEENEIQTEEEEEETLDLSMMEELFEEKDNVITSYSFVVVKKEDSYESIASRYHVDVEALKSVNNDKEIHEKSLIVLPYAK
ncbi:MAG: LysM domain-containing protein [Erysipelotrichia bacterium]|nr:LysM domain-containing protein [Erysipelotrichia bacterium]